MSNQTGFERQGQKTHSKSWSLRLFLFAINVFLLYLIIDSIFLQRLSYVLLGISLFVVLVGFVRARFSKQQKTDDSIRDLFPLVGKYLRINRKYLLASILGLILGVMVISQILVVSNSATGSAYESVFGNGTIPFFEAVNENFEPGGSTQDLGEIRQSVFDEFKRLTLEDEIVAKEVLHHSEYEFWLPIERNIPGEPSFMDSQNFHNSYLTQERLDILEDFPSFPTGVELDQDPIILVLSEWTYENSAESYNTILSNGKTNFSNFETETNFTLPIDHLWVFTESDVQYSFSNDFGDLFYRLDTSIMMSSDSAETLLEGNATNRRNSLLGFVDIDSLVDKEVQEVLQSLRSINSQIQNYIINQGYNVYVTSEVEWRLDNYQDQNSAINFVLLLVSVPMIGIAMYLVYFSLNLVEIRKQKLVAIMKIRGISTNQLRIMMVTEAMLAAVIATGLGMLFSLPWSELVFSSTEIFGPDTHIIVPQTWYWKMPLIGLILAFDLNIGAILSIASTTVEEGEVSEEMNEPFWRRLYLDVIFTVLGGGFWATMHLIQLNPNIRFFLLIQIGIFALLFLVIGLPLFISRYYSDFLSIISDFLWKREGNLFALATRNMRKNRFSSSKLAVLIITGMMFSFVAISVPHSFNTWSAQQAQYEVGADMHLSNLNITNSTHLDPLGIPEVKGYSQVKSAQFFRSGGSYNQLAVLGVNSTTYADVAFWDSSYATTSLKNLMEVLDEGKILVQSDALSVLDLEVGNSLVAQLSNVESGNPVGGDDLLSEEIGGTFKFWPMILNSLYYDEFRINQVTAILPLDMFDSYLNQTTNLMLVDLDDGANHTLIHEQLKTSYANYTSVIGGSIDIQTARVSADVFLQNTATILLFTMFDTLLLVTLVASVIGVGYFSFITLAERRREIGVFRAVGMVSRQIFILLVVESLILVSTSIILGVLSGMFVSSNFFLLLGNEFSGGGIPPIQLTYPIPFTIGYVAIILAASIFAAAIPARSTARKQTGSILRAE